MTMGSHQATIGKSQVHLTPWRILDPLGAFDLDPCGNDPRPWDCARVTYTEKDNGLVLPWHGRVWLNSPFHRYLIALWLRRMAGHNRGIALVHARTETDWFQIIRQNATALFWIAGRVIFCQPDGSPQIITKPTSKHFGKKANSVAPVVLAAFGFDDSDVLSELLAPHEGAELSLGLFGDFDPLQFQRFILIGGFKDATWRELVVEILRASDEPIGLPISTAPSATIRRPKPIRTGARSCGRRCSAGRGGRSRAINGWRHEVHGRREDGNPAAARSGDIRCGQYPPHGHDGD